MALLEFPAYLRFGPEGTLWTLDTSRRSVIGFASDGEVRYRAGRRGRGPGELWTTIGFDVTPDGDVWVADVGNGKISRFRRGGLVGEFYPPHATLGVVASKTGGLWIVGDLVRTLAAQFDTAGEHLRDAPPPINTRVDALRLNQGVLTSGGSTCDAVWAYTFRSLLECWNERGEIEWRVEGPVPVTQPEAVHPWRASHKDVFSYVDVAADSAFVYALFLGSPPHKTHGISTREIHVFDVNTGSFAGRTLLPQRARYIAVDGTSLATLVADPYPRIRVFRVREER